MAKKEIVKRGRPSEKPPQQKEVEESGTRAKVDEFGMTSNYNADTIAKALALYSLYHSFRKVGDIMAIDPSTISRWVKNAEKNAELKKQYSAHAELVQRDILSATAITMEKALQVVYDKLEDASAAQAATIFGIIFDKRNILMGNAAASNTNVIIDTSGMSDDDKASLLRRALSRTETVPTQGEVIDIDPDDTAE